jgi:catechol-2,3-dioxygenase
MLPTSITTRLFIDHLVLTIQDINRSATFYSAIFGDPAYRNEAEVMYHIGPTRLFLMLPHGEPLPNDRFDPKRIGKLKKPSTKAPSPTAVSTSTNTAAKKKFGWMTPIK